MQNGLMAAGYCLLFFSILHHPLRRLMRVFLFATAFAALYNVTYEVSIRIPAIASLALIVRLLPPIEACWRVTGRRRDLHVALAGAAASIVLGAEREAWFSWGYLQVRDLLTAATAVICILFALTERFSTFGQPRVWRTHLSLQTVWAASHTLFSVTSGWYTATWPRRTAARWAYVVSAMGLVLIYRRFLTNPPAQSEEGEALHSDRPRHRSRWGQSTPPAEY
jgi:hypothetical protein